MISYLVAGCMLVVVFSATVAAVSVATLCFQAAVKGMQRG